jgi:glycosyltransferase involved in cell wall biosynthesis
MTSPRFSILIPTRDRPATFRHTLATAAEQPGDDYEIVVADNCGTQVTKEIVDEFQAKSSKIRYLRSDTILPMAENWERGLSACSGDYVTVIGDDDGLLPSTLIAARQILAATKAEVVSWDLPTYWWPDAIVRWNANRLFLNFGSNEAVWVSARETLRQFYDNEISFGMLPMIYQAFVHKNCIDKVRQRYGRYFYPPKLAPDVTSGILNLSVVEKFLFSERPLSIRGNSGKSIGTAQWARSLGAERRETYFREEGAKLAEIIHPSLVPSPNLQITIENVKIYMKELCFPDDPAIKVNLPGIVSGMLRSLNFEPEAYEDNLADARALAQKLGIQISPADIPPKRMSEQKPFSGPLRGENKAIRGVGVDCDRAGIFNIADAARLVESMLLPIRT